jgi:capsular exopolysaccharide synthesis family protein
MELRDLVRTLKRFRLLAAAVFALAVAAGVVAAFVPEERYRSTATLLVEPSGEDVDFSDVEAVRFLLPALVERVDTSAFRATVRSQVSPAFRRADVDLEADIEEGTGLVRLTAEAARPVVAASYANTAARALIRQRVSSRIGISTLDAADVPDSPSSPRKVPIMLGSVLFGLLLALFSALAANALRREIQDSDELRDRFGLEVLAEIPQARRFPANTLELFNGYGDQRIVEAFQRLRTNFGIVSGRENLAITITSCGPGEGKSTVTANLAWVLASLGPDVVAIDCDLRRPALHEFLGADLERGIGNFTNGADVRTLTQQTPLSSLSVISAGTTDRHPTEVLYTTLPRLLEAFQDKLVLVDTPPMLGVAESTLIATMTRAVLLVIDGRQTARTDLEQVLQDLRRANVWVLGAVVNRGKPAGSAYYYK